MTMVIGLHSGYQFVVQDKSFFIQDQAGGINQIFISDDGKRRFIVKKDDIEFYDEPNTQEYLDTIAESIKETKTRTEAQKKEAFYG